MSFSTYVVDRRGAGPRIVGADEVEEPPVDRAALTARLTYLAVELSDQALGGLVDHAEGLASVFSRPLDAAALNADQVAREASGA